MQASVRLEHQVLSVESDHHVHAMVELTVPKADDAAVRPPLRLALVLDRSGSMAGAKLAVAQRCAAWLAERLRPQDEFALVSFDDEVRLHAPLAPVSDSRRPSAAQSHAISSRVRRLRTRGGGRWCLAASSVASHSRSARMRAARSRAPSW